MPSSEPSLGEKIRYFRKDRGVSQTELEVKAGLSFGTLSRIEKGSVNPTKETILKIAPILGLTDQDVAYLLKLKGSTPTTDEIAKMVQSIQGELQNEIFPCYLLDNKFRICAYNELVREILEIPKEEADDYLYMTVTKLFFLSKYNIRQRIPAKHLFSIVKEQIAIFRFLTSRYHEESDIKQELNALKADPQFRSIWNAESNIVSDTMLNNVDFYLRYQQHILNMTINRAHILSDSRFLLVTYFPKDLETATIFEQIREKVAQYARNSIIKL